LRREITVVADKLQELFQIVFDTSGAEGVTKLVATLRSLANTGDEADAKLSPLADELERIGQTKEAIATLTSTKAALAETGDAIAKTQQQLQALNIALLDPKASKSFTKEANAAQASLVRLTAQQKEQQLELTKAQGIIARSGIDTRNLASANEELGARAANVAKQAQLIVPALQQSGAAAKETAAGFAEIVEKSSFLSRVVEQVKGVVAAVAGLFVLEKARTAIEEIVAEGDKVARLRGQFEAAFGGVAAGADAFERVNAMAQNLPLSLDEIQAAAIRAKKQGLDPFDGTLESLVASNAKFGGDIGSLNARIDLLGKATQRGTLSLKDLVSLQQDGIPAAQLLGDALGKTSDEVLDLAKSGQLGRNAVSLLIDALGRAGAADAAGEMGLLSTLVTKVKDEWQDFLGLIAESGAYDFVKQQIGAINNALRSGLADGSLKSAAQGISDTIVGVGRAIVGTTKFVVDHAAAIGVAIRGYVLFRATLLALDLAGAAAKFLSLSDSAKRAGDAAAEAAAESGGFGKLGARIKAIPKAIQIAIVVAAVDEALTQVEALIEKSKEYYETQNLQKSIDADIAAQREKLAVRAAAIADQLKGAADTQIASAEQLAGMSRDQAAAYIEQLQNATRYYTALRIQADQAGDSSGVSAATSVLQSLGVALQSAQAQYQSLDEAIKASNATVAGAVSRFDQLKTSGLSAAESVAGAFEHVEIPTPQGVDDVLSILQQISIRSRDARNAVQSELVEALTKLDQQDLRNFQNNVTQRLAEAKGKADELKLALGAALQASLQKLGLSAQQSGVQITKVGEDLIATFDDIVRNADSSSQQVQLAFAQALSKASTEGEVSALQASLTAAFGAGKISAEQFAAASEASGRALADIRAGAIEASASLDGMGTSGETNAQRISSALQDARDKLVVEANGIAKAINDALASGDEAGANALRAQFKSVDAELQSLNSRIDSVGSHLSDIGKKPIPAPDASQFKAGVRDIEQSVGEAANAFAGNAKNAEDAVNNISGALGNALSAQAAYMSEFAQQGNALQEFTRATREFFDGAGTFSQQAIADSTGIIRYGEAVAQAGKIIQSQIDQQKVEVQGLAEQWQNLTDQQILQRKQSGQSLDTLAESLRGDAAAAREGYSAFTLLGRADLSPLSSALDAAAQKVEQLKERAVEAKQELSDMASSIQDQIDQANGDQVSIEQRRFENQLKQIKDLAEQSGTLNSEEYRKAVERAKELHDINLRNIRDEADAKKAADSGTSTTNSGGGNAGGGPGGGTNSGGGGGISRQVLDLNVNGKNLQGVDFDDPATQKKVTAVVLNVLRNAAKSTGRFAG
jgi:tape measure domain-containing protein